MLSLPNIGFFRGIRASTSCWPISSLCRPTPLEVEEESPGGEPAPGESALVPPCTRIEASAPSPGTTHLPGSPASYNLWLDPVKFCAKMGVLSGGRQVHCYVTKSGNPQGISLQNHLLKLYVKCGRLSSAVKLLDEMPRRNIISWNTVISGFAGYCSGGGSAVGDALVTSHPSPKNLFSFFLKRMMLDMVKPDHITFMGVFRACVELDSVIHGELAHCLVVKLGYSSHCYVGTAVVDMYAKFGLTHPARSVFDMISARDLVLWNVMISCYALNGLGKEAFEMFKLMGSQGILGDLYTFSSLLNSSSSLRCIEFGQQIHGIVIKSSLDSDVVVGSAIVDMYGKCGDTKSAHKAFDLMNVQNVVSWNSIIVSYGKTGDMEQSVKLLRQMLRGATRPDELTLSSVLNSCAELAKANEVLQVHNYAGKSGLESFLSIGNALIGAYGKCGHIYNAFLSFSSISKPDVITWTSMISAYAFNGLGNEALEIFEMMLWAGQKPDGIVFLVILSACSHSRLVDAGIWYFVSMVNDYQIEPNSEHYACMVDLLGRAGFLDDAQKLLRSIPSKCSASSLGAFLGACKLHGNVRLAKWAADLLFTLQPNEPINYMLMSNIYAAAECRESAERVRSMMRRVCWKKLLGCSWIELCHTSHSFLPDAETHPIVINTSITL